MSESKKTCGYWHKQDDKWRFITKTVDASFGCQDLPLFDGKISMAFICQGVLPNKAIRNLYKQTRGMFLPEPWYKRWFRKVKEWMI